MLGHVGSSGFEKVTEWRHLDDHRARKNLETLPPAVQESLFGKLNFEVTQTNRPKDVSQKVRTSALYTPAMLPFNQNLRMGCID